MSKFLYALVYIRPFINLQFFSRHRHQNILSPNLILHLPPSSDLAYAIHQTGGPFILAMHSFLLLVSLLRRVWRYVWSNFIPVIELMQLISSGMPQLVLLKKTIMATDVTKNLIPHHLHRMHILNERKHQHQHG